MKFAQRNHAHLLTFSIFILVILASVTCSSCHNSVNIPESVDSLYGLWEYEDTASHIYVRLKLREDNKAFYSYYKVVSEDSVVENSCTFRTFTLSQQELLFTDKDSNSVTVRIRNYSDSLLVLDEIIDIHESICFSRWSKFSKEYDWLLPEDSLDFIVHDSLCENPDFNSKYARSLEITDEHIAQALCLMKTCADRDSVSFECYVKDLYPLNWYIRQYSGYINKQGHIILEVSLALNNRRLWERCIDKDGPHVDGYLLSFYICDGGPNYADATIDLTLNKVLYFKTHGEA